MAVTRYCKRSYAQDTGFFQTQWIVFWTALLVAGLVCLPWICSAYLLNVLILCGINSISALGLNILIGYTGLISLGHAAFMAVGSYSYALGVTKLGLPFFGALVFGALMAALVGMIVGLPSLRLKGFYLAIATLAFHFITEHILYHGSGLTNGPLGIELTRPEWAGGLLQSDKGVFYLVYGCLAASMIIARNIFNSKVGRAFVAIRDSEISAKVIGVDLAQYKLISFMISSFYAGLAGGLLALHFMFINPEIFNFWLSIQFIGMIIVGGMGSIQGSVFGAVFLTFLPEGLRYLTDFLAGSYPVFLKLFYEIRVFMNGLVIVVFLIFEPDGLNGRWRDIENYWKNWPFTY